MRFAPPVRVRTLNDAELRPDGKFVLYWMIANRRTRYNFSLQQAVAHARQLGKPLVVLEALRCDYPWAGDRFHRFVIDGMRDNARAFGKTAVRYYPYIEPEKNAGKGLLRALSEVACLIVTDDFPCFMLPAMVAAGARQSSVRMEAVDSNGLYPMAATDRVFGSAHSFRRHLQKELLEHLLEPPQENPLARLQLPPARLPRSIAERWPQATDRALRGESDWLASLPIDHFVAPTGEAGGSAAAAVSLDGFVASYRGGYDRLRNHPAEKATSGLSPFLHFGHLSAHEIFRAIADAEEWEPGLLAARASGSREGWWGMSAPAEAFIDQLVTWRELGYNICRHRRGYATYGSLPEWARKTLEDHAGDTREHLYHPRQFEHSETHDEIWNAAQTQLRRTGRMHNYLRMLWGKKILEWSPTPRDALQTMIHLNNKYALDGRNPNSYSGIFWILGRYDRPWGPERPIFGKVRYMSSDNTRRKLRFGDYLTQFAPAPKQPTLF